MFSTVLVSLTLFVLVLFPLCLFWKFFSKTFILKCRNYACIRIMIILYIPLTSKKCKFQPQTSSLPGNNSPFSIKSTVLWVKISEKKNISFSGLRSRYNRLANRRKLILPLEKYFKALKDMISGTELCTIFQSGQNNGVKLWVFDEYSRAFPCKVTTNIDFTDKVVILCDDVKVVMVIYK